MADVKREKELAERRKNDPQLDSTQDHLVRKLFSRFRKGDRPSTGSSLQTDLSITKDIEKGDSVKASDSENEIGDGAGAVTKVVKVFPASKEKDDGESTAAPPKPTFPRPKGKWGALLKGGDAPSPKAPAPQPPPASRDSSTEEKLQSTESTSRPPLVKLGGVGGNKVFPKQSARPIVQSSREDTIEEVTESSPITKKKVEQTTVLVEQVKSKPTPVVPPASSAEFSQLNATLMDFKVDVQLEIQRLNQKMSKLEGLLGDVLTKLNQQLNGPGGGAGSSSHSPYPQHHLLSPTSPMHSDTHDRDTSPASGGEEEGRRRTHRSGSGGHHHHHHHKHRDRSRKHDKEKTPDTLSPEARISSTDPKARAADKKREKSKERRKVSTDSTAPGGSASSTPRASTSDTSTTVQAASDVEIGPGGSSSSKTAGVTLIPVKAVIIPTGQQSQEFL